MCSFSGATCTSRDVTMQITFLPRKSALIYRRDLRQRVASLTLNCNGVMAIRAYAFVLASMYRYSWLITFEIFHNFFFWIEGWVGGVYRIQTFFGFLYFLYIYKAPKLNISDAMKWKYLSTYVTLPKTIKLINIELFYS